MPIKATYQSEKKKAKIFTGGKPKDFILTTDAPGCTGAQIDAKMSPSGKAYIIKTTTACSFNSADMRQVADHLNELADITDGKADA